jgi:hypothetical protein
MEWLPVFGGLRFLKIKMEIMKTSEQRAQEIYLKEWTRNKISTIPEVKVANNKSHSKKKMGLLAITIALIILLIGYLK